MLREERECRQLNDIVGVRAVAGAVDTIPYMALSLNNASQQLPQGIYK